LRIYKEQESNLILPEHDDDEMVLLNTVLKKVHIVSLGVPNYGISQNNPLHKAEQRSIYFFSFFPSLFVCLFVCLFLSFFLSFFLLAARFTLSCRILLLAHPTSSSCVWFAFAEICGRSAWVVLFRPPWHCLLL